MITLNPLTLEGNHVKLEICAAQLGVQGVAGSRRGDQVVVPLLLSFMVMIVFIQHSNHIDNQKIPIFHFFNPFLLYMSCCNQS